MSGLLPMALASGGRDFGVANAAKGHMITRTNPGGELEATRFVETENTGEKVGWV